MQRLSANLKIENVGSNKCSNCKQPISAHEGDDCLFDSTKLEAPPLQRLVALFGRGKHPTEGKLTLEITGGHSISYLIQCRSFSMTVNSEPPHYEIGRLSAVPGQNQGFSIELDFIGGGP